MNRMNCLIRASLNQALGALHALSDQGETVIGVRVESRNPVLTIEPPHSELVRAAGVMKTRVVAHGQRITICAARLHGVQVEWQLHDRVAHRSAVAS